MTLAPDTLIHGRYRIVRPIGRGGMGAVYEAIDERLGVTVALKQTLFFGDPQFDRAFEREAKLLASLRHRALSKVTDFFTDADGQFLVMEFIPGDDLATMLRERDIPFDVSTVLTWAEQLLTALEFLHSRQPSIIHRDIKPQNLKLTPQGDVILLDFGLAKGIGTTQAQSTSGQSLLAFTPQYAPPEQIEGGITDTRSDLYSVGATIYCLLTGDGPPTATARARAVVTGNDDPLQPLSALNPEVSQSLSAAVMQAMALDPRQRLQNVGAFQEMLHQATTELSTSIAPPADPVPQDRPKRRIASLPLLLGGMGIALLIGLILVINNSNNLILNEDFSDNDNNWATGVVTESNGFVLTRTITREGFYSWDQFSPDSRTSYHSSVITQALIDFEASLSINQIEGNDDIAYGFAFHHTDIGTYEFTIRNTSEYRIRRWDESYSKVIDLISWKRTPFLKISDSNKITARAEGNTVQFFANENLIDKITIDRYPEGQIGIIIAYPEQQHFTLHLDDFEIRDLSKE